MNFDDCIIYIMFYLILFRFFMGPDGFGHRQEISSSETSVAIDKRESRVQIKWLAFDSSYTALYKSGTKF